MDTFRGTVEIMLNYINDEKQQIRVNAIMKSVHYTNSLYVDFAFFV